MIPTISDAQMITFPWSPERNQYYIPTYNQYNKIQWDSREDVVDADYAVRSGGAAVVDDGGVALDPDPAAVLRQETIILSGDLAFH